MNKADCFGHKANRRGGRTEISFKTHMSSPSHFSAAEKEDLRHCTPSPVTSSSGDGGTCLLLFYWKEYEPAKQCRQFLHSLLYTSTHLQMSDHG